MGEGAALDTDVLLKTAAYRLAAEVVEILGSTGQLGALGLTHLIAGRQLARQRNLRDRDGAAAELEKLLAMLARLEPSDHEVEIAAELVAEAQARGLPLDTGEAQLAAIVVGRGIPLLVTGDKRALGALASLVETGVLRAPLVGRLVCFEQVVASVAKLVGEAELRERVCAEPEADGTMRLVFSCGQSGWNLDHFEEACISFIGAVRNEVGDLLLPGLTLT